MADLDFLTYATVTATAKGIFGDTWDPGFDPDYFNPWADVTLTPRIIGLPAGYPVNEWRLPDASPPLLLILAPMAARIETGRLRAVRSPAPSTDPPDAGEVEEQEEFIGVRILAETAALDLPDGAHLVYDVAFGDMKINGLTFRYRNFTFAAPTIDTTIDLAKVERINEPPSAGNTLVLRMIPDGYYQDEDGFIVFTSNGIALGDPVDLTASAVSNGDGTITL